MVGRKESSRAFVVSAAQACAFRLYRQNLASRLPPGGLLTAAGACGVQNTPPGSAALALHARVARLGPGAIDRALEIDKTLLQTWSMRASPYIFPTADAAIFTLGLLPGDEESTRAFIFGAGPALDRIGVSATEVVAHTVTSLREVLDRRELTKDDLGLELAKQVERRLNPAQRRQWRLPSWYAAGQHLGESVVRFALAIASLQGALCFAPRRGRAAALIRTEQWLDASLSKANRKLARAELARRYLHCYGPSDSAGFAAWAGIAPAQAARAWKLVESELIAVDFEGQAAWLGEADLPAFKSPPQAEGIRFLPPHDPYLQLRDRETLVPDRARQRHLWRASGNPGVVLAGGRLAAMWRAEKNGRRLMMTVELLEAVSPRMRAEIDAEADTVAPYKRCESAAVRFVNFKG